VLGPVWPRLLMTSFLLHRDTVDSVGIIPKRLPFTTSNTIVRTFRHAVALDERRAKFKANLWNRPTKEEEQLGIQNLPAVNSSPSESMPSTPTVGRAHTRTDSQPSLSFKLPQFGKSSEKKLKESAQKGGHDEKKRAATIGIPIDSHDDKVLNTFERMYSEKHEHMTDIEEVWFAVSNTVLRLSHLGFFTRYRGPKQIR